MFEIVLFPCAASLLMLLFSFLWSRKCVCMLWVCSGLTGALEKPAVSGGCWTAVLTWLLVYLQQYWGQCFINLRAKWRGLFSPLSISAADLQMRLWKCNPHRLQGELARTVWKGSIWSIILTSLFQSGVMLDVLFFVSFQIKHNCLALVEQLCGACLVMNISLQHISHNNNVANAKRIVWSTIHVFFF